MLRNLSGLCLCLIMTTTVNAKFDIKREKENNPYRENRNFAPYTKTHFNRVEGFTLNLGARLKSQRVSNLVLWGDAGHGFKNEKGKRFRWNTGVKKKLFIPGQLTLGFDYFNKVTTNDRWLISGYENTIASIFFKEDFFDYFGKKGGEFYVDYRLSQTHTIRLNLASHRYEPLQRNTNWSLFGGDKSYPLNTRTQKPVIEGNEKSIQIATVFDWRDNPIFPFLGWYADLQYEYTFDNFETHGLFFAIKRYQPLFLDHKAQIKFLFGTRKGSDAFQHLLPLGGVGNLRGYKEKEFIGNRLLYMNANYIIGQEWLRYLPLQFIPIWEAISLGFFAETGYAWDVDQKANLFELEDFDLNDLRHDLGWSLYLSENILRVDFAYRTDRGHDNWRILVRILDKF